jgi:diadenosine tetraphosphate (Ap4A) HIT family hydrolase/8-oxo-dGTP pyrophosphatase MutT (NUDIX family)
MDLSPQDQKKQELYRDARYTKQYDRIWQSTGKCVFCDLRDKYILREENGLVLTVSLFAYIDGHLMIIPRRHVSSVKELTQAEWDTVRKFTYLAKKMIKDVHHIRGMQVLLREGGAVAQSTVAEHLHIHCIPFDAPDLSVWNVRKLKYTPLESVALYRHEDKQLESLGQRFEKKYRAAAGLPILTDLIIVNDRREILFQERPDWAKLVPDIITVPGGGVNDYTAPLEHELAREVREETGARIDPAAVKLIASRIEVLSGRDRTVYPGGQKRVLWNTYLLEGFDSTTPLTPGDDAEALIWVPLADIPNHPRISAGIKQTIREHLK